MNGLLVVDKPSGMTSHDVVSRLRRATGESMHRPSGYTGSNGDRGVAGFAGEVHPPRPILRPAAQDLHRIDPVWICHRYLRRRGYPGIAGGDGRSFAFQPGNPGRRCALSRPGGANSSTLLGQESRWQARLQVCAAWGNRSVKAGVAPDRGVHRRRAAGRMCRVYDPHFLWRLCALGGP